MRLFCVEKERGLKMEVKKELEATKTVSLYLPLPLVQAIDNARGQISRNEFIKNLVIKQMQVQA